MFRLEKEKMTAVSNITIGEESRSGNDFWFADFVYDNNEERCPMGCDVSNIAECKNFTELIEDIVKPICEEADVPIHFEISITIEAEYQSEERAIMDGYTQLPGEDKGVYYKESSDGRLSFAKVIGY